MGGAGLGVGWLVDCMWLPRLHEGAILSHVCTLDVRTIHVAGLVLTATMRLNFSVQCVL